MLSKLTAALLAAPAATYDLVLVPPTSFYAQPRSGFPLNHGGGFPFAPQFSVLAPDPELLTLFNSMRRHVVTSPSTFEMDHGQWVEEDHGHLKTTLHLRGFDTASLQAELNVNDQTLTVRGSKEAPGYKSSVSRVLKLPTQAEPTEIQLEHDPLSGRVSVRVPKRTEPERAPNIPLAIKMSTADPEKQEETSQGAEKQREALENSFADKFRFVQALVDAADGPSPDVAQEPSALVDAADEPSSESAPKAPLGHVPGMP